MRSQCFGLCGRFCQMPWVEGILMPAVMRFAGEVVIVVFVPFVNRVCGFRWAA